MVRAGVLLGVVRGMKGEECDKELLRGLNWEELDLLEKALTISLERGKGNRGYEGNGEIMQAA